MMLLKKQTRVSGPFGLVSAAALLLAATNGRAQYINNFFLGVNAGGAFQQQVAIQNGFNGLPGDLKFSPGWTVDGDVGYSFSRFLSADLDCGIIWNNITTVGDQPLAGVGSAHLAEIPLLVDGVFTYPLGHFKPYLGAGLGSAVGIFDSSNIPGSGPSFSDTDVTFAYQAEAGLKYSLSHNIELGLAYRFVGTSRHSWTDNGINLSTDGTMTHLIEATFTWKF
jgi:OmpA-OmpF porin, OOP family